MNRFYLYGILFWFVIAVLMVSNGIVRGLTYEKALGQLPAHILSSITGSAIILIAAYVFVRNVSSPYTTGNLLALGGIWLVMTVLFEFGFGYYVVGHPWERLIADYNILKGRIWSLVLLVVLLAPYIAGRLAGRSG